MGVLYPQSEVILPSVFELSHLHHLLPLGWCEPLSLVQVDLGLVQPGADVSQVLIKNFHLILVTLNKYRRKNKRL